jgi:hypothetical protein
LFERWFQTVAIDVHLLLNSVVVFSSTYFLFCFEKPSLNAIGMKIGKAHRTYWRIEHKKDKNVRILNWQGEGTFGAPIMDENYFISVLATGPTPVPMPAHHKNIGYAPFLSLSLSSLYASFRQR